MKFEKRKPPPSPAKNTSNPQTTQLLATTSTTKTNQKNKPDGTLQPKKQSPRSSCAKQTTNNNIKIEFYFLGFHFYAT
jgi:hypothetical protein